MLKKTLRVLGSIIQTIIVPVGTNLLGLALALAVFLPLGILMQKFGRRIEGVANFIGGSLICGIDCLLRRPREFYAGESLSRLSWELLFDWERGARFFFLPIWIWGVIWMVSGFVTAIVELTKG